MNRLSIGLLCLWVAIARGLAAPGVVPASSGSSGALGSLSAFNSTQFSTNGGVVSLKAGSLETNLNTRGLGTNRGDLFVEGAAVFNSGTSGEIVMTSAGAVVWGPGNLSELDEGGNIVMGVGTAISAKSITAANGITNNGPGLTLGTSLLTGATNNGDFTNAGMMQVNGTANFRSNLVVSAGQGAASNAWVGGTYFQQIGTAFTNLNGTPATLTNLGNVSIAGHTLTNNGDRLVLEGGIQLQIAKANTNRFQIVWGSTTLLDTGLQIASNAPVRLGCTIARTGNTSAHVEAWLHWGPAVVPFATTNVNIEIAETNGIATLLAIRGSSQAVGAHTNNYFVVEWKPASR